MSLGGSSLSIGLKRPAERGTPTSGCNDTPDSPVPTAGATTPIKVNICGSILVDIWRMCRSVNIQTSSFYDTPSHVGRRRFGFSLFFFPLSSFKLFSLLQPNHGITEISLVLQKLSFLPFWVCRYGQIYISLARCTPFAAISWIGELADDVFLSVDASHRNSRAQWNRSWQKISTRRVLGSKLFVYC